MLTDFVTTLDWTGNPYGRFRWAESLFADKKYLEAARQLEALIEEVGQDEDTRHAITDARLLLARSYYHAASLKPAEQVARAVLDEDPTEAYAALLLARCLQRQSRADEAEQAMNLARALGAPGT